MSPELKKAWELVKELFRNDSGPADRNITYEMEDDALTLVDNHFKDLENMYWGEL